MNCQSIPAGYEFVAERVPCIGENYLSEGGSVLTASSSKISVKRGLCRTIIRKTGVDSFAPILTVETARSFRILGALLNEGQARQLHRELDEALDG